MAVKTEAGPEVQAQPAAAVSAMQPAAEAPALPADAAPAAAGTEPSGVQPPQSQHYEEWRWRLLSFTVLPSELAPAAMPHQGCSGMLDMYSGQLLWQVT